MAKKKDLNDRLTKESNDDKIQVVDPFGATALPKKIYRAEERKRDIKSRRQKDRHKSRKQKERHTEQKTERHTIRANGRKTDIWSRRKEIVVTAM